MDKLTAIRTFAAPGFTPARHVKIFKDRWYRVRFQNVERDPRCDYVGLGEGEYTQLLPGAKAREARDARLNHCNGISEYHGSVFALYTTRYGRMNDNAEYFTGLDEMHAGLCARSREHAKWIEDCGKELRQHIERQQAKPEDWRAEAILSCAAVIQKYANAFDYRAERIR